MNKLFKNKNGFTLLFASLVVSLLLSIGLAILNITLQQVLLSSAAKESQFAFYNADTGIECALYWDKNGPSGRIFATSSQSNSLVASDINCNGVTASAWSSALSNSGDGSWDTSFDLIYPTGECDVVKNPTTPIVHIVVNKSFPDNINTYTDIKSRGYNTCDANNPRRVERGLEVQY
ncbi:MAG TPA: pilus assembly PilX N-terminal domain-containing protein [Candidatus Paceibacterota bacterium]|nr:pilus assembly PilX N-terminal domain-containing protein [Candidatus Paceibacterota bacterium]